MIKKLFGRVDSEPDRLQVSRLVPRRSTTSMRKLLGLGKQDEPLPISHPIPRSWNGTPSPRQVSARPLPPFADDQRGETVVEHAAALLAATSQPTLDSLDPLQRQKHTEHEHVTDPEPDTFHHKAKALYPYTADDPTEISLSPGEILYVVDKQADWSCVRNANGGVGLAPSNYFQLL
ncbi:hypothetical protein K438DRAFT_1838764 [Mycena galopus ATCC 62051]|nr:hypothetical protein K438DRAFT_1838764 [Mycena galopus ATCC 62051]